MIRLLQLLKLRRKEICGKALHIIQTCKEVVPKQRRNDKSMD
ncbi:hypothetical protein X975_14279, partial [Stegodyphus mimosarum]